MSFHPYLFFGGNCRQAFERYHEVFGGELVLITFGDMPGGDAPAGSPDLIAHAALKIGDDLLMASDDPINVPFGPVHGMQVNVALPDAAEATRVFDALADGGTVGQAIGPTSFASAFGMCTDRFGTPWMVTAYGPA